jgi:hypothetical protein
MPAFNSSTDFDNTRNLLTISENTIEQPPDPEEELPVQKRRDGYHIGVAEGLSIVLGPSQRGSGAPARARLIRARSCKQMTSVVVNARGDSDVETHTEASRCPLCRRRPESVAHETVRISIVPGPAASAEEVTAMERAVDERVTPSSRWRDVADETVSIDGETSAVDGSDERADTPDAQPGPGEAGAEETPLTRHEILARMERLTEHIELMEKERDRLGAILDTLDGGGPSTDDAQASARGRLLD